MHILLPERLFLHYVVFCFLHKLSELRGGEGRLKLIYSIHKVDGIFILTTERMPYNTLTERWSWTSSCQTSNSQSSSVLASNRIEL